MKASRRRMRWLGAAAVLALLLTWGLARAWQGDSPLEPSAGGRAVADHQAGAPASTQEPPTEDAAEGAAEDSDHPGHEVTPNHTRDLATPARLGEWIHDEMDARHSGPSLRDIDVFFVAGRAGIHQVVHLRSERNKAVTVRDAAGVELASARGLEIVREVVPTAEGLLSIEVTGHLGSYALCVAGAGTTCHEGVLRVAGGDPHTRTAQLSSLLPTRPSSVILVSSRPTELTIAAALAVRTRAPLLSRPVVGLSQTVGLELARLRPDHIVVLGGVESTPDAIMRAAAAFAGGRERGTGDPDVTLLRGEDAVRTAATAADQFPPRCPVAYVVGENDASAAINAAVLIARTPGPVLVTQQDSVPHETARALARLAPRQVVVLGSSDAVSDAVASRLGRYAGSPLPVPVTRVDADPREVSVAVADGFGEQVSEAYLVSSTDPAGALAAAARAARAGAPVLVTGLELSDEVEAALLRLRPRVVFVVGGPGVIGTDTEERVARTLEGGQPGIVR